MSWYRRYRPQSIAGLHLTKVRETLSQLMKQGKMPQALLFAGPKGTGKTSTSRIIAAILNDPANRETVENIFFKKNNSANKPLQEPNPQEDIIKRIQSGSSFVVHELDAASNRGIDDIRQLKERLMLPPQEGLISVYILDEAHMLTTEAFNALLKVLEEPPAHVVFILATTELHKIPSTIVSRCTIVPFTKATVAEITQSLQNILDQEKITFEAEALELIADRADGSFRDGVKLLELVAQTFGEIKLAGVEQLTQGNVTQEIKNLVAAVIAKNAQEVVTLFENMRAKAIDAQYFEKSLFEYLHTQVLRHFGLKPEAAEISGAIAQFLLKELLSIPPTQSPIPLLPLELKLLDVIERAKTKGEKPSGGSGSGEKIAMATSATSSSSVKSNSKSEATAPMTAIAAEPIDSTEPTDDFAILDEVPDLIAEAPFEMQTSDNLIMPSTADSAELLSKWQEFIEGVKSHNSSLAAILNSAKPSRKDEKTAIIQVYYQFHKEQLQQPKFLKMIEDSVEHVLGGRVGLEFLVVQPDTVNSNSTVNPTITTTAPASGDLATVALEALS